MRKIARPIAITSLAAVSCSVLVATNVSAAPNVTSPPAPSSQVVGPMAPPTGSSSLSKVENTYLTMKYTVYSHKYSRNAKTGRYAWDCVGMTDWILHRAAPQAWTAMHTTLNIGRGKVPTPSRWSNYLQGQNGNLPKSWQRETKISNLRPGSYLLFQKNTNTRFVGHAVISAGKPVLMSDGTYALLVFDSTGTTHGPYDSRWTDGRAQRTKGRSNGSGLGFGTMRIHVDSAGRMTGADWSVLDGGPSMANIPVVAARAVR